jgi:hypothetical protein
MDVLRSFSNYFPKLRTQSGTSGNELTQPSPPASPTGVDTNTTPSTRPKLQHSQSVDSSQVHFTSVFHKMSFDSQMSSSSGLSSPPHHHSPKLLDRINEHETIYSSTVVTSSSPPAPVPYGLLACGRPRANSQRHNSLCNDEVLRDLCATSMQ